MDLTLYVDASWNSPWAFHAFVAITEKELPFAVRTLDLDAGAARTPDFRARSVTGKIPALVHGERWISESTAISEYLAETFPYPAHPRLFPADLGDRARARQIMAFLRTDLFALRKERPSQRMFGSAEHPPLSAEGKADADELVRVAELTVPEGRVSLCAEWCIADADLAFALQRLGLAGYPLSEKLAAYVKATWSRPSVRGFVDKKR